MLGGERRRMPLSGAVAALALVSVTFGAVAPSSTAWAYRPFDQTDADVAPVHEVELEIGPVALQRSRDELIVVAPLLVVNYGLAPHIELVAEGRNERAFGAAADHRWRPQELALSIKAVVREGSLQGGRGPSI